MPQNWLCPHQSVDTVHKMECLLMWVDLELKLCINGLSYLTNFVNCTFYFFISFLIFCCSSLWELQGVLVIKLKYIGQVNLGRSLKCGTNLRQTQQSQPHLKEPLHIGKSWTLVKLGKEEWIDVMNAYYLIASLNVQQLHLRQSSKIIISFVS